MEACSVLHVDDDDDDAFAIADAIARCDRPVKLHRVIHGAEAVQYLESIEGSSDAGAVPKLILLDLNMPTMTGHQFLKWRGQHALKRVPVVVLTSSQAATDIRLAQQGGANAYVVKPARRAEMDAMLSATVAFWLQWAK